MEYLERTARGIYSPLGGPYHTREKTERARSLFFPPNEARARKRSIVEETLAAYKIRLALIAEKATREKAKERRFFFLLWSRFWAAVQRVSNSPPRFCVSKRETGCYVSAVLLLLLLRLTFDLR